jgi:predicted HTH transcriptional regulator
METSHYNTTKESGKQLEIFEQTAKNQESQILELMKLYKKLSPSDIEEKTDNLILTSIRRALTNLTKDGKLIKTSEKKKGIYGRDEYLWEIKTD